MAEVLGSLWLRFLKEGGRYVQTCAEKCGCYCSVEILKKNVVAWWYITKSGGTCAILASRVLTCLSSPPLMVPAISIPAAFFEGILGSYHRQFTCSVLTP
jgi:hypothetical protein